MQDPNEDTEWNDILRKKGIIPEKKKEITEDDIVQMVESTIENKTKEGKALDELDLDELDELEDEEDERVLEQYRRQRMAEIMATQQRAKFGDVIEISAENYVREVNQAGEGIRVVLHLYKQGIPLCALINQHLTALAAKFPDVKFIKSISTTCIPNYPDKNLPTIFVYESGSLKSQLAGPQQFRGTNLSQDELEYMLGQLGGVKTSIKEDPRPAVKDVMFSSLGNGKEKAKQEDGSDSDNDW